MRAVAQRVASAGVDVGGQSRANIQRGLLVYVGVDREDTDADAQYLADKVRFLRVFADELGRMNLDVAQAGGACLVVSAFTVQADARRGRRPTLEAAAEPARALVLYEKFCEILAGLGVRVERGSFGADMQVRSVNDGPICILLESRRAF